MLLQVVDTGSGAADLLQLYVHWQEMQLLSQYTLSEGRSQVVPPGGVMLLGMRRHTAPS